MARAAMRAVLLCALAACAAAAPVLLVGDTLAAHAAQQLPSLPLWRLDRALHRTCVAVTCHDGHVRTLLADVAVGALAAHVRAAALR
jgi:hypothetical protein